MKNATNNKKKKSSTTLKTIIPLIVGAVCGVLGAAFVKKFVKKDVSLLLFLIFIVSLIVTYLLTTIIHEAGHLVFGLLSGYKFLSFRIGSLTLIKRNNKYEFKKFSIPGTAGQCLLAPPENGDPQKIPFFLYHAGGGIFNLLSALIVLPILLTVNNSTVKIVLGIFCVFSVFQGLCNLIPIKAQVPNDGYNLLMMIRKPSERTAVYKSLLVNALLFKGSTPSQIAPENYELGSEGFYKAVEPMLKGSALIDSLDFEGAEKLFAQCAEDDTITVYQLESRAELMFCKIMNGAPAEEIDDIYDKELARYMSAAAKTLISKRRQLYAYQLLHKHDTQAAEKEYQAAMKIKDTYPIEGEVVSELKVINAVKARAESLK